MEKPELLVPVGDLTSLIGLLDAGADAVVIGTDPYALRLPGSFSIDEMERAVFEVRIREKKIYIAINTLFHNDMLKGLSSYIAKIKQLGVDAIEFSDPAVLMIVKQEAPDIELHWNPEMVATSYHTLNYWQSKGVVRGWLARELNMEEVIECKENAEIEVSVQVHGTSCIFHSKRPLVQSYFDFMSTNKPGTENDQNQGLSLKEEKRDDVTYPIFEDQSGTHIMSHDDCCILEHLDELMDAGIDSFRIETVLKSLEYNEVVVRAYRQAIDFYFESSDRYYEQIDNLLDSIQVAQDRNRPLTTGFYFKELIF